MANKVLKSFRDKTDKSKLYKKGDTYTHEDANRVAFLVEKGYLEKSKQPPEENEDELKHVGGGYYELPNGEKVQGKEKALEALAELEGGA